MTIRIGTRGSALALAQAALVETALRRAGAVTEIVVIRTEGDRRPDQPTRALGIGAFVAELEHALRDRRVDVAAHSAKDLPADGAADLALAAYLAREDPADVLITRHGAMLADLPPGASIGTESPRRRAFILAARRDLSVRGIRGNVDTRLRKLEGGEVDALVLAAAGLARLGLSDRVAERFDPSVMPPAVGQGALVAQCRDGDTVTRNLLDAIDDLSTHAAVDAERAFLAALGGGCLRPVGALAVVRGRRVEITGAVADPDGREILRADLAASGDRATEAGAALAARLRAMGADRLLASVVS
jgi:hydroxymethylbilane synthase